MAVSTSDPSLLVLFNYYAATGGERFVELKRPEFKGNEDISRYVSWFRVSPEPAAEKLSFVSWDKPEGKPEVRTFGQGVLSTEGSAGIFRAGGAP
ncbi:hypothetical protein AK812_SmicGene6628 [Symbiodinium microadriaticum]|uniref:Uncharacterized protein n=1 Tax=Symbiodinium microadriaticum TaxID=2951 RepID=A0A1Q9EQR0_SYMMI|nr:hypothetical protein AK812_SmicGene6628 [Symbiodinium microadriaticum]